MSANAPGSADARKRWELENSITDAAAGPSGSGAAGAGGTDARTAAELDSLFRYDAQQQRDIQNAKPWAANPHHYQNVRCSALALIKMAMHARSGGDIEVMGMLVGKVVDDTFIVLDSFALPVEGTETRVNAGAEAYEYMVEFRESNALVGRAENVVGWYHSHPGYGCWLSGIDCSTQMLNQQYQEPWLAVVIDPVRTVASGKVEIGAFRTYPEGYVPKDGSGTSDYQTIPLSKIEDFGVHAKQYYPLPMTFFKSAADADMLDQLWSKYWVNTLSSSTLVTNRGFVAGQLADLAEKLEQAHAQGSGSGGARGAGGFGLGAGAGGGGAGGGEKKAKDEVSALSKVARDSAKAAAEQINGLITQCIKSEAFNKRIVGVPADGGAEPMVE